MYAMMAIPAMISAILLSPRVKQEMVRYFVTLKKREDSD